VADAIARDRLRYAGAASRALELAEPDGLLLPFLLRPAPGLLERHSRLRSTHSSLISEVLNALSGNSSARGVEDAAPLQEPLSESELRVLRYLPTNLRAPEIAAELFVSLNTIRTHLRKRVRQARRAQPRGRGQTGTRPRPVIALLAQALSWGGHHLCAGPGRGSEPRPGSESGGRRSSSLIDRAYTPAAVCSWSSAAL
jgi:DNA-binding CsgD family transcriptional regulator